MKKKQSNNNRILVDKQVETNNPPSSTPQKSKIRSALEIIGLSLPLIGGSFAAGRYYEDSLKTFENNEKIMKLHIEFRHNQESNEKTIHELRNQVYELQNELLNCKKTRQ